MFSPRRAAREIRRANMGPGVRPASIERPRAAPSATPLFSYLTFDVYLPDYGNINKNDYLLISHTMIVCYLVESKLLNRFQQRELRSHWVCSSRLVTSEIDAIFQFEFQ